MGRWLLQSWSSLLAFHWRSGNCLLEESGWELPGRELVGSHGSFPLGFLVLTALPSPREEAANENTGVVKRQSLSCPYFHWRG